MEEAVAGRPQTVSATARPSFVDFRPPTAPQQCPLEFGTTETENLETTSKQPLSSEYRPREYSATDWDLLFRPSHNEAGECEGDFEVVESCSKEQGFPGKEVIFDDVVETEPLEQCETHLARLHSSQAAVRPSTRSQKIFGEEVDEDDIYQMPIPKWSAATWDPPRRVSVLVTANEVLDSGPIGDVGVAATHHRRGVPAFALLNVCLSVGLWFLATDAQNAAGVCGELISTILIAFALDIVLLQSLRIAIRAWRRAARDGKHWWECELHPYDGQTRRFI